MSRIKSRRWVLTSFNMENDPINWESTYVCRGLETCPTTARLHWQGYIEVAKACQLSKMKRLDPTVNFQPARGTVEENKTYTSKSTDDWKERGVPKEHGEGQGKRTDLDAVKTLLDTGATMLDVADKHFPLFCQYRGAFEQYISLKEEVRNWVPEVIVLTGPAGYGKTRRAIDDGAVSVTYRNGFFGGYNGEDVVVFDDF